MRDITSIRKNIRAIEQTRQITNAMYLLSTSRMRRALDQMEYCKRYMRSIRSNVLDIVKKSEALHHHRYLDERSGSALFLVITSDKGLCGAYNQNVVRTAIEKINQYENFRIETVGIEGAEALRNRGYKVSRQWLGAAQSPSVYYARTIGEHLVDLYDRGIADEVFVVYTKYHNQLSQFPLCRRVLSLETEDFEDVSIEYEYDSKIIYEPSDESVFDTLAKQYVIGFLYGAMTQAMASEHIARMNAMQSATKNADEMIKKLSRDYAAARQEQITNEITEIAAAAELSSI